MPYGHLSGIVAMTETRLIGANNTLPWRLPADLKYFRQLTMGKPVVMGRKTHESIGKALPGRLNLVLSQDATLQLPAGCQLVNSLDAILALTEHHAEVMVIGGAQLYRLCLPHMQRLYVTWVYGNFVGDTYFPAYDPAAWQEVRQREGVTDADNLYPHCFSLLERIADC